MKFIVILDYSNQKPERVVIDKVIGFISGSIDAYMTLGCVVKVTEDFDMEAIISVVRDTASVQYRPKALYKKGDKYYYNNNGRVYLTDSEVSDLGIFMEESKQFIKTNLV